MLTRDDDDLGQTIYTGFKDRLMSLGESKGDVMRGVLGRHLGIISNAVQIYDLGTS